MNEFELGPSSISTLHFIPDYIQQALNDNGLNDNDINDIQEAKHNQININTFDAYNEDNDDNGNTRSNRVINTKAMSDYETMGFIAMRDILHIDPDELAKLYNYNKREYDTFQAVLNNKQINYINWLNNDEIIILYYFFGGISNRDSWIEICNDLGFGQSFDSVHFNHLFVHISNLKIRAKDDKLHELRFFLKLIILYWDNISQTQTLNTHMGQLQNQNIQFVNFTYFWVQCIHKIIKFISELNIGINVEMYCLIKQEWIIGTINKANKHHKQICIQYLDGTNKQEWVSIYCDRIAPIGFKYFYTPNTAKTNYVPCITAIIDHQLRKLTVKSVQARNAQSFTNINVNNDDQYPPILHNEVHRNTNVNNAASNIIPKEGWYFQSNETNETYGPLSIGMLFMACVQKQIDDNSIIYHQQFGKTQLKQLPHIIYAFRLHVQKCKEKLDAALSGGMHSNIHRETQELSIFTNTTNTSSYNPAIGTHGANFNYRNHNDNNIFIPESNEGDFNN